jgi:DNA-binding response OmpR family regulator
MKKESIKNITTKLTLLYAEDNDTQRKYIAKILEQDFKKVIVAKDGEEVLNLLKEHRVQIILLDYMMDKVSGYDVALQLREKGCKIPVIISSDSSEKENLINAIKAGAIHYIQKPITQEKLQNAFEIACDTLQQNDLVKVVFSEKDCLYDRVEQIFYCAKNEIKLSKNEKAIFELLLQNRGFLVTKQTIKQEIFDNEISDNALTNAIYRLRKKVGTDIIKTIQQHGFRIV